jgi:hypothetical protein
MAAIGKVSAVFTASTSGLTSGVNRASQSMKGLQASVGSLRGSMQALVAIQGAQLFGSVVAGASRAARSLIAYGQAEAETIDQTSKLAARLGFTYSEMAGLALAGNLAGVSLDQLGAAATKADVAFIKAANGSKASAAAFAAIGLSVEQLNGLSASDRFNAIAEAISQLPTEAERAAAAVAIFGRSGAELLPLFNQGAGAIAAARAEAERFGLTLTNAQGQNVEEMNDAFTRAQSAIQGVIQQVVAYLAPEVESVTTAFSDLVGNIGGANIGQAIGEGILQGARYLAEIGDFVIQNLNSVFAYLSTVGGQWGVVWGIADRVGQFLFGVAKLFEAAFRGIAALMTNVAGRFLEAAGQIASAIPGWGQTGAQLLAAGASLRASSGELANGAAAALEASGQAFGNAILGRDELGQAGQAIAGPLVQTLDEAIAAARDAASQVDVAAKQEIDIKQTTTIDAKDIKEAVKGIESSSAEGIREMFRIMRGDTGDDVQERQLGVLERIAANTEDMGGFDIEAVDLAPAAGG